MTEESAATDTYVCEHCDDSVPHQHVDEKPLVERYRRELLVGVLLTAAVAVVGLGVMVLGLESWVGLPLGALAWAIGTAVGLLVLAVARTRTSTPVAVVLGAVASAAVSPVLALLVAVVVPGSAGWVALAGGSGWLVLSALIAGIRAGTLRDLLTQHTRDGEAARSGVVRSEGRPSPYVEAAWLVATAVVFGLCVLATAALPILVVLLVPLNVVIAVLSRRWQVRAAAQG